MGYRIAVVGATGLVGREMLAVLHQRQFPASEVIALASRQSVGKEVPFGDKTLAVRELTDDSFDKVQIALFSAGATVSKRFAPAAVKAGATVVDNTSAFRMDPQYPLVVPEVNAEAAIQGIRSIIANPNCSTIQMVVALEPIRKAAGIKRIVVSTYQSVSGAGTKAVCELEDQTRAWMKGEELCAKVLAYPIFSECLPQIGDFLPELDTAEERKMVNETQKIFGDPSIRVCATTVRVPVLKCHSESLNVELKRALSVSDARKLLSSAPGIALVDDPDDRRYPLARMAAGRDPVYVGRLRQDFSVEHGLNLWVVADNIRKGAALNAVQIAEWLVGQGHI